MEGPDAAYSAINLGANAGGKLYFKPSTVREPLRSSGCGPVWFSSLLRGDTQKGFAVSHSTTYWITGSCIPRQIW